MNDPYEELGVDKDATTDDIRKQFRKRSVREHPDAGGDPDKYRDLVAAHDLLTNDEAREHYDRTGEASSRGQRERQVYVEVAKLAAVAFETCDKNGKDVIEFMREQISTSRRKMIEKKAELEVIKCKWESRLKKFRKSNKDKDNKEGVEIIESMIQSEIAAAERTMANIEEDIAQSHEAEELIKGLECPNERPDYGDMKDPNTFVKFYIDWGGTTA